MQKRYAVCDIETGRVLQAHCIDRQYIEIDDDTDINAVCAVDGKIVPCPRVTMTATNGLTGDPVTPEFGFTEWAQPPPEQFRIRVNEVEAWFTPGNTIVFDEPGEYRLQIIGPWPWESNPVFITIQENPNESGKGGVIPPHQII